MAERHFCLELLESRQLLAGVSSIVSSADATTAAESIITTSPANGAVLTQSPSSLTVTFFNQNVRFYWIGRIVQLEQVNNDGSTTPLFGPENLGLASLDPAGTQATIPLSQTLAPGHYRIVLVGSSLVSYVINAGLWDPAVDQTLADFTIVHPAPTLSDAKDLGTVGSQVQSISGSLDLSHGVANANLYKVTLAAGQEWQLGVELDAQREGSALRGALTLFDQQGHVLATRDAGTGRLDAPADPYLFTDLNPGVYYIGVSGAKNVAGQPGGYNPVDGTFGTSGQAQAGGAYDLKVVANPVFPISVIGVGLQWGDLQGASPTGLVLAFSGSIDVSSVKDLVQNHAVWAVDQSGHIWNLTPDSYVESRAELGFVFDQPLPSGQYTLINSAGGIVDLGGQAPVANGLPQGELATWTVPVRTVPSYPGNLGVVWPLQAGGVSQSLMILPGESTTSRVVIPVDGLYTLQTSVSMGSLAVEHQGPGGLVVVDPGSQGPSHQYTLVLSAGVYEFTFRAVGTQPVLATWQLKPASIDYESLIDNGVGQTPALSLRLLNFSSSNLTTAPPAGWLDPVSGDRSPAAAPAAAPAFASSSVAAFALSQGTTVAAAPTPSVSPIYESLLVTVNSGLLGEPSSQVGPIGVIATTVPTGLTAVFDRSAGLSPMIAGLWYGRLENTDGAAPATSGDARGDGVKLASLELKAAVSDPAQESADALAISRSDRIVELGLLLAQWLSPAVITGTQEIPNGAPSALPEMLAAIEAERVRGQDLRQPGHSDRIDQANLAIPTGLIVVSAAAYRLRQFTGRWWRRSRRESWSQAKAQIHPSDAARGTGTGPRSFRRSDAATTYVRAPHQRQTINT